MWVVNLVKKDRGAEGVGNMVNVKSIITIFVLSEIRQCYSNSENIFRL